MHIVNDFNPRNRAHRLLAMLLFCCFMALGASLYFH